MKFRDMQYSRIDPDKTAAAYAAITARVEDAQELCTVIESIEEHEKLYSETESMVTIAQIRKSIDTNDAFYKAENDFYDEKMPLLEQAQKGFYEALMKSRFLPSLKQKYGSLLFTNIDIALKSFSPEIIPDLQEENRLITRYNDIVAGAKIEFRGGVYNVSQLAKFKQDKDRGTREAAFRAEGEFYVSHADELDAIFDDLVRCRTALAKKLGYDSFTAVGYLRNGRNCYGPDDVRAFRAGVVKDLVPVVNDLKTAQAARLGLDKLKYYDDVCIFPDGNPAPSSDSKVILAAGQRMYEEMSPETARFIHFLYDNELLDVEAKPGKQVGGYCTDIFKYGSPFIFSNFNGTSSDVEVLTHEAGHAFASYMSRNIEMLELRSPTMESCECHSMSMEFFAWNWLHLYYGKAVDKAKYAHLANCVSFIPYGCQVDEFQHIMYDEPDLTPAQRNAIWLELEGKYRPYNDFDSLPFYGEGRGWQRQLHIFQCPFYYIDYCLAQTVALMFWNESQKDFTHAWARYLAFVKCGGTKTFRELTDTADLRSPFTPGALNDAAAAAGKWLKARG